MLSELLLVVVSDPELIARLVSAKALLLYAVSPAVDVFSPDLFWTLLPCVPELLSVLRFWVALFTSETMPEELRF